jgi:hypothetical protein
MKNHAFNFDGGEILSKIAASWFVSYAYYSYIDEEEKNWVKVSHSSRISRFNNSKQYHNFWLKQVLQMNDNNLNKNKIGLCAERIKEMAKITLQRLENSPPLLSG